MPASHYRRVHKENSDNAVQRAIDRPKMYFRLSISTRFFYVIVPVRPSSIIVAFSANAGPESVSESKVDNVDIHRVHTAHD